AAREMTRVAAAHAILVASTWTVSPSWFWTAVCERAGLPSAAGEPLPAGKDFERSPAGFARMLFDGGWCSVEATEVSWTGRVPSDALWKSAEGGVASAGACYLTLDADDRQRFRSAFVELCDEKSVGGFIALDHTAALAVGRAG